jgi:hypothetical protein
MGSAAHECPWSTPKHVGGDPLVTKHSLFHIIVGSPMLSANAVRIQRSIKDGCGWGVSAMGHSVCALLVGV